IARVQELAIVLRDRLSFDTWRLLSGLGESLGAPRAEQTLVSGEPVTILHEVILRLAAFEGLAMENMTRAQGWRFLDMGHRIERSVYLCDLLGFALSSSEADNPSLLEALLEIADCSLTYRSRYNLLPNIAEVYDL